MRLLNRALPLPLERKLPLFIFGVFALVLALSVGVSYYEMRHVAEVSAAERLASLSKVLSTAMSDPMSVRFAVMRRVANDSAIERALRSPSQPLSPEARRALGTLVLGRVEGVTLPQLWTPDGRPVGAVRLDTPAELERFQNQLRAHKSVSDTVHVGPIGLVAGQATIWQAVPVRRGSELLGYIAQERRFGLSPRMAQTVRDLIGSEIEFFLRNVEGDTWVGMQGNGVTTPTNVRQADNGVQVFTHGARGEVLASTSVVQGTPIAVTIEQPMRTILARPRSMLRALTAIALVLAGLGAVLAWVIGRQLAAPLVDLTRAAEAMALGNYEERVSAGTADEIGRLGAAFNRMADEVQAASNASTDAVRQLTKSVSTQLFLAEASRILAGSLSDQILLTELARYCVPRIGDCCSIYVAEDDGTLRHVETAHHDPAKADAARALASQHRYRIDGPEQIPSAIRSQDPFIIPQIDRAELLASAPTAEAARLIEEVGPTSFLCVPLVARGRGFGAMAFMMTDSGRVFSHEDADLAVELARRTAVAIDNALIYRRSLALRMEAEAASSAKSDFLAKMSHEIRTPINAMMGYAELLEMGISGPVSPPQAKQLRRIRASGEHLTSLVNEILDLAKIEAGRMAVEPVNALAAEAIEVSLALVRPQASSKGIDLVSRIDTETTVEYVGDPQRVQQILTNLLTNAVKFTPAGGRVTLQCGTAQRPVRGQNGGELFTPWTSITVMDTGVGIARSDLERIFDPFVQVEGGYTRLQGGTGLGLTISRALAQLMGGEISVESVVGEGSRFTLWLPSPASCVTEA